MDFETVYEWNGSGFSSLISFGSQELIRIAAFEQGGNCAPDIWGMDNSGNIYQASTHLGGILHNICERYSFSSKTPPSTCTDSSPVDDITTNYLICNGGLYNWGGSSWTQEISGPCPHAIQGDGSGDGFVHLGYAPGGSVYCWSPGQTGFYSPQFYYWTPQRGVLRRPPAPAESGLCGSWINPTRVSLGDNRGVWQGSATGLMTMRCVSLFGSCLAATLTVMSACGGKTNGVATDDGGLGADGASSGGKVDGGSGSSGASGSGGGADGGGTSSGSSGAAEGGGGDAASGKDGGGSSGADGAIDANGASCQPLPGCTSTTECPSTDGCNTCNCEQGGWECTGYSCPDGGNIGCPPNPPGNDSPCSNQFVGTQCNFPLAPGVYACRTWACTCWAGDLWYCAQTDCPDGGNSSGCPTNEPSQGSSCDSAGTVCGFGVCGTDDRKFADDCLCSGGMWDCSPVAACSTDGG